MTTDNQRKCECYAIIHDEERKQRFAGIFENDHIPIKYPFLAGNASTPMPGKGDVQYTFYEADSSRFSEEQKKQVAVVIAPAFKLKVDEVLEYLNDPNFVVPLNADAVSVMWCGLHSRIVMFSALDRPDDEDNDEPDDYEEAFSERDYP